MSATKTWSAPVPEEEVAETLAAWRECSSAPLTAALLLALSIKVQWADDAAAARVTPKQTSAYLKRTGWTSIPESVWRPRDEVAWAKGDEWDVVVPLRPLYRDYPRRMSNLIRTVADAEQRSPIAVWLDLLAEAP